MTLTSGGGGGAGEALLVLHASSSVTDRRSTGPGRPKTDIGDIDISSPTTARAPVRAAEPIASLERCARIQFLILTRSGGLRPRAPEGRFWPLEGQFCY